MYVTTENQVNGKELLMDLICFIDLMAQAIPQNEFKPCQIAIKLLQQDVASGVSEKVKRLLSQATKRERADRIIRSSRIMFAR